MSACFALWRLADAHVTCVDSWDGWHSTPDLEQRFESNVALIDPTRVRKLSGRSRDVLPGLIDAAERFDFIYIDASHVALDVLVDAAHSWQLLAEGGLLVFDDYGLSFGIPMLEPTAAIDAFLTVVASECTPVEGGHQVIVRRTRERSSVVSDRQPPFARQL
jgi:hypothetical protein